MSNSDVDRRKTELRKRAKEAEDTLQEQADLIEKLTHNLEMVRNQRDYYYDKCKRTSEEPGLYVRMSVWSEGDTAYLTENAYFYPGMIYLTKGTKVTVTGWIKNRVVVEAKRDGEQLIISPDKLTREKEIK